MALSNVRSNLEMEVKIDKDPELMNLTAEARRLSMGGSAKRTGELSNDFPSANSPSHNGSNSLSPKNSVSQQQRGTSPFHSLSPKNSVSNRANSPFNRTSSPINRANSPINRTHSPVCPLASQNTVATL